MMKKILFLSLLISVPVIGFIWFKKAHYPAVFEQQLMIQRRSMHDTALRKIRTDFQVKDALWAEYMDTFEAVKAQDDLINKNAQLLTLSPEEHELVALTKKVLQEYGIDVKRVTISLQKPSNSPAQANQTLDNNGRVQHIINLDPKALKKYSLNAVEAVIRHEVIHLLNYDALEGSYLISMLYKAGWSRQEVDNHPSIIAYRQARESCADLCAACNRPEVAHGLQEFFGSFLETTDQDDPAVWKSHPSDSTRIAQLDQLKLDMPIKIA